MNIQVDDCSEFDEENIYILQLITNTSLLTYCRGILDPRLASNKYTEHVLRWVMHYYDLTGKAPQKDITSLYLENKGKIDKDEAENIQILLSNLDGNADYSVNNVEHNANNIITYFNWRKLTLHQEDMKKAVEMKDVDRGLSLITNYHEIAKTQADSYNPYRDHEETYNCFVSDDEVVLRMQGDMGAVMGDFVKGDVTALVAKQKSGKSMLCLAVMEEAVNQGKKVLYYNLEIAKKQMKRRTWQLLNKMPKKAGKYRIPYFDSSNRICWKEVAISQKDLKLDIDSIKKRANVMRMQKRGRMEIITIPRMKATLSDLKIKTKQLEKELNFVPDIIIIDNPDCMNYKESNNELKDEENLWAKMSGWASEDNIAIFAPTHGNRKSFSSKGFNIDGLGGSYGKLKSVGKMLQLIMTPEMKAEGYAKISVFEGTERDENSTYGEAICLVALDFCQWGIDSRLEKDVILDML